MADSHHYSAYVHDPTVAENEFTTFELLNECGKFLRDVVGNGWEYIHFTGSHQGPFDAYKYDYLLENDNPFDAAVAAGGASGSGIHFVVNPSESTTDLAQTVYLKWTGGGEEVWENYFYISTIKQATGGSVFWNDIRTGYLDEPYVDPIENLASWGMWWNQTTLTWDGTYPDGDPADYGYSAWPTKGVPFEPPPVRDNVHPANYQAQRGYSSDTITDRLLQGAHVYPDRLDSLITCHMFGGVSDGAPYFYCCIESGEDVVGVSNKHYVHFGVGKISKIGNWRGGQFAVGTRWTTGDTSNFGGEYHSRMFDSWSTRYCSNRSKLAFTKNLDPYDAEDPETKVEHYLFGYSYNNYPLYCYGNLLENGFSDYVRDDARLNTWRNDSWTMPNYITVKDYETTNYKMLVGIAPAIRGIWMDNIQAGTVITEAGIDWMILPPKARKSAGTDHSGFYGYAYRIS